MSQEPAVTSQGGIFASPLRYPGGKGRLGPWIARLMRHNRISGGLYVEPYAGGAGAAIYLLTRGYVDHIVINDLDRVVHAFWWAILNDTERFLGMLDQTAVTMETWRQQKVVHSTPENYSQTEIGFATFFLNRTNRSGILTAGAIGGKNQTGPYSLSARYNKADLTSRIREISKLRRHISIYQDDALDLIANISTDLPKRSLIYLDPPYYTKGSLLYKNHYNSEDHFRISQIITQIQSPWIVSYDNCSEIRKLYQNHPGMEFCLHYSTSKARPIASEVMFYGNLEMQEPPALTRRN